MPLSDNLPSYEALDASQLHRLASVFCTPVSIPSFLPTLPTITFRPADFCFTLRQEIENEGIAVNDLCLVGSAAAFCLNPFRAGSFNDLDVEFHLANICRESLGRIRSIVLRCLMRQLPTALQTTDEFSASSAYLSNMFLSPDHGQNDAWALLTLRGTEKSPSLDLKFVQHISRPYQFSIDSFQIFVDEVDLQPLFSSFNPAGVVSSHPLVIARSSFGDIKVALEHLANNVISVHKASDMASVHGGGLLKYCLLRAKGFTCDSGVDVGLLEKYMCNRFFVDFPSYDLTVDAIPIQQHKLQDYFTNHLYKRDLKLHLAFLNTLKHLIETHAGHAGRNFAHFISFMIASVQGQSNRPFQPTSAAENRRKSRMNYAVEPSVDRKAKASLTRGRGSLQDMRRPTENRIRNATASKPPSPVEHPLQLIHAGDSSDETTSIASSCSSATMEDQFTRNNAILSF